MAFPGKAVQVRAEHTSAGIRLVYIEADGTEWKTDERAQSVQLPIADDALDKLVVVKKEPKEGS